MSKLSLARRVIFLMAFAIGLTAYWINAQGDTPRPLYMLPNETVPVFTTSTIALANDGRTLIAANMLNDTVSFADPFTGELRAEVSVGDDPRFVTLTDDNLSALVVNRGDGTLSVVNLEDFVVTATYDLGLLPYGIVRGNNSTAYVALQGSDEVIQVDTITGEIVRRAAVPAQPAGLTLWGDFLYVTHLWSGRLSLIYLPEMQVVRTVETGAGASLAHTMTINPQTGLAYIPQSRSNNDRDILTYDSAVLPFVGVVDLATMTQQDRISLEIADRPVNMPFASRIVRDSLYIVNAGSDDVSIIDLQTGLATGHVDVGANPRGAVPSRDNSLVFVHNMIDGSITSIDTRTIQRSDLLPISDLNVPIDTLIGAQLFHSAEDPRLSRDNWVSCASCHFDGQSDGRVWQGRNTPMLYQLPDTAPYTWTRDWDEIADVEYKIRFLQGGDGLLEVPVNELLGEAHAGQSLDLDTLTAYLSMLSVPSTDENEINAQVEAGRELFEALDCAACHAEPHGTNGQAYAVGTGGEYDTPALIALWQSAPYFHDGRADTLYDVFAMTGAHQLVDAYTRDEIENLIVYLRSR